MTPGQKILADAFRVGLEIEILGLRCVVVPGEWWRETWNGIHEQHRFFRPELALLNLRSFVVRDYATESEDPKNSDIQEISIIRGLAGRL
jgi:hypothetical protein